MNPTKRVPISAALLVLFYVVAAFLPYGLLIDRDEGWYASIAHTMFETGNWVVPIYNGKWFLDKPPLTYWLAATAFHFFGISEWSARLFMVISTGLAAWGVFRLSRALKFSRETALRAAWIFSTFIFTGLLGHAIMMDAPLVAALVFTLTELIRGRYVRAGLFLGLAFLAKGLIGIGFSLGTFALWRLSLRDWSFLKWHGFPGFKKFHRSIYVVVFPFLLVTLPWVIAVTLQTEGLFLSEFFWKQHVVRASSVIEGHDGPIWYYLPVFLLSTLPWTPLALGAIADAFRGSNQDSGAPAWSRLALLGVFFPIIAFSLMTTKLPHYLYPAFPFLALLCAKTLEAKRKFLSTWFGILVLTGLSWTLLWLVAYGPLVSLTDSMTWLSIALSIVLIFGLFFLKTASDRVTALGLGSMASITFLLLGWSGVFVAFSKTEHIAPQMATLTRQALSPGQVVVITQDVIEPSMIFYLRQSAEILHPTPENISATLNRGAALITRKENLPLELPPDAKISTLTGQRLGKTERLTLVSVVPKLNAH